MHFTTKKVHGKPKNFSKKIWFLEIVATEVSAIMGKKILILETAIKQEKKKNVQ